MPRKPTPPPEDPQADANGELIEQDAKAIDQDRERLELIEDQYGAPLPYSRASSIAKIHVTMRISAAAYLEGGLELLRIKEHEPHGEFTRIVTEEIGLHERTARRMMKIALKYQGSLKSLTERLNPSKLLALTDESDEELGGLPDGGTLAGYTLDEIDRMTSSELRKTLRADRAELADKKAQIVTGIAQLQDLKDENKKLRGVREVMTTDQRAEELNDKLDKVVWEMVTVSVGLRAVVAEIHRDAGLPYDLQVAASQGVDRVRQSLAKIAEDYGLTDLLTEDGIPEWVKECEADDAAKQEPEEDPELH